MMAATDENIQKVVEKIVQEYQPDKIILFGSHAFGSSREWSDIDFFIVKESDKKPIDRERELRTILFGNNFPPLDLLVYTPKELQKRIALEDFFVQDILEKGKVLYAK
jgi:predicted nucleotidyltransferase